VGRGVKYFSKLGVGEFRIEATDISVGDRLLVIGPTVGARYFDCETIYFDDHSVGQATKGQNVSIPVPDKVRPSDKLYKIVKTAAPQ
jgi:putative protease